MSNEFSIYLPPLLFFCFVLIIRYIPIFVCDEGGSFRERPGIKLWLWTVNWINYPGSCFFVFLGQNFCTVGIWNRV